MGRVIHFEILTNQPGRAAEFYKIDWLAYAKDTEGNLFGLLQEDKTPLKV